MGIDLHYEAMDVISHAYSRYRKAELIVKGVKGCGSFLWMGLRYSESIYIHVT